jgi:hypothetical protein
MKQYKFGADNLPSEFKSIVYSNKPAVSQAVLTADATARPSLASPGVVMQEAAVDTTGVAEAR